MLKLHLIIADSDQAYIESLVGFLMDKHPHKFLVNSFTNKNSFWEFISKSVQKENTDILLITPDFFYDLNMSNNPNTSVTCNPNTPVIILLSDTKSISVSNTIDASQNADTIFKYQSGDRLISDVLRIYNKHCKNTEFLLKDMNKSKLISVYSPVGGAGKSTIAINACINCARGGLRVFYANFESISSIPYFFENSLGNNHLSNYESNCNFSNIIFAMKERDKNLHMKVEGVKFTDSTYDIHYILPPDSALEMEEIQPEEVSYYLNEVRSTGNYNIIFADLSSTLDLKSITVMEESDEIILVCIPDYISRLKIISFYKEIQLYQKRKGINLLEKMTLVINKYDENIPQEIKDNINNGISGISDVSDINDINDICSLMGKTQYVTIPVQNRSISNKGNQYIYLGGNTGELSSINKELRKLTDKYTTRENGGTAIW